MRVDAVDDGRLQLGLVELLLVVGDEAVSPRLLHGAAQFLDLPLHLGVLGPLPNTFEVRLDLALELEAVAPRTALERILYDIAAQLLAKKGRPPQTVSKNCHSS